MFYALMRVLGVVPGVELSNHGEHTWLAECAGSVSDQLNQLRGVCRCRVTDRFSSAQYLSAGPPCWCRGPFHLRGHPGISAAGCNYVH